MQVLGRCAEALGVIGGRIAARAREVGLRPIEIAVAVGVSQSTVERWIRGKAEPRARYLVPLAELLGVTVEWLLTGEP
jgi:HTH-type transcriptional regulator, cell division transcriptional repressor